MSGPCYAWILVAAAVDDDGLYTPATARTEEQSRPRVRTDPCAGSTARAYGPCLRARTARAPAGVVVGADQPGGPRDRHDENCIPCPLSCLIVLM